MSRGLLSALWRVGAAVVLISAIAGHRHDVELRQGAAVDVVFDGPAVLE